MMIHTSDSKMCRIPASISQPELQREVPGQLGLHHKTLSQTNKLKTKQRGCVWWYMPIIVALERSKIQGHP